mmetsp:Transcript_30914/g.70678  ORF Transcript_30914/g.70678 Transcript_30914/m.70678 type:complete len:98 (+) Transcript_30914:453-746(+)
MDVSGNGDIGLQMSDNNTMVMLVKDLKKMRRELALRPRGNEPNLISQLIQATDKLVYLSAEVLQNPDAVILIYLAFGRFYHKTLLLAHSLMNYKCME